MTQSSTQPTTPMPEQKPATPGTTAVPLTEAQKKAEAEKAQNANAKT